MDWQPYQPTGSDHTFYADMGVMQRMEASELGSRWRFKVDDIECSPPMLHIYLERKMARLGLLPKDYEILKVYDQNGNEI
jgi:hypothetical protein